MMRIALFAAVLVLGACFVAMPASADPIVIVGGFLESHGWPPCDWGSIDTSIPPNHIPPRIFLDPSCIVPPS